MTWWPTHKPLTLRLQPISNNLPVPVFVALYFTFHVNCPKSTIPRNSASRNKRQPQDIFCWMVYYPTVFIISTSSPAWNAIRRWAILYFQVIARARWTTVPNIKVLNDQHNAFSFTCCNFPAAFLVRTVKPWIVRTGKNSWCLIQGCHIGTDCKPYKWTDCKYRGHIRIIPLLRKNLVNAREKELDQNQMRDGRI